LKCDSNNYIQQKIEEHLYSNVTTFCNEILQYNPKRTKRSVISG